MNKSKIVLAYSGGLDTSVILKWLCNQGFQVICFIGDVGQNQNFDAIKQKAFDLGASKVYVEDLKHEFITQYIFTALKANALYEGKYLLGTALARPLLAKKQIQIAKKEDAEFVSHGATAKGNDQVRFELSYYALEPNIKIFSPWKNKKFLHKFKGRSDLINYAKQQNIPIKATKSKPYSEDENLMHISHEAGILEDPAHSPDKNIFFTSSIEEAPNHKTNIQIIFEKGIPKKVINLDDGTIKSTPVDIFMYLNQLGSINAIGQLDMVENRFIGIKSRGIYESPGATILWKAHHDLEGITMDKEVMHLRDILVPKFAEIIYNGFWFSPEMDFLISAFEKSQENVSGKVNVSLIKGNAIISGRESEFSLYNQGLSSMDIEGGFNANYSKGVIEINALRLKAYKKVFK